MKTLLVTGSCGLIGSEVAAYFAKLGWRIVGVDNNFRAVFFGPEGDTSWSLQRLRELFEARREGYARAEYRIDSAGDDASATVTQILALSLL